MQSRSSNTSKSFLLTCQTMCIYVKLLLKKSRCYVLLHKNHDLLHCGPLQCETKIISVKIILELMATELHYSRKKFAHLHWFLGWLSKTIAFMVKPNTGILTKISQFFSSWFCCCCFCFVLFAFFAFSHIEKNSFLKNRNLDIFLLPL